MIFFQNILQSVYYTCITKRKTINMYQCFTEILVKMLLHALAIVLVQCIHVKETDETQSDDNFHISSMVIMATMIMMMMMMMMN